MFEDLDIDFVELSTFCGVFMERNVKSFPSGHRCFYHVMYRVLATCDCVFLCDCAPLSSGPLYP